MWDMTPKATKIINTQSKTHSQMHTWNGGYQRGRECRNTRRVEVTYSIMKQHRTFGVTTPQIFVMLLTNGMYMDDSVVTAREELGWWRR